MERQVNCFQLFGGLGGEGSGSITDKKQVLESLLKPLLLILNVSLKSTLRNKIHKLSNYEAQEKQGINLKLFPNYENDWDPVGGRRKFVLENLKKVN